MQRWRGVAAWGIVLCSIGLLLFGTWLAIFNLSRPETTITIGGVGVKAFVVQNRDDLDRGLALIDKLNGGRGMLYVYPQDGALPVSSKGMNSSLDVVWLDDSKQVVNIERNLAPTLSEHTYESKRPARYILALPAGTVANAQITLTTSAAFTLK